MFKCDRKVTSTKQTGGKTQEFPAGTKIEEKYLDMKSVEAGLKTGFWKEVAASADNAGN